MYKWCNDAKKKYLGATTWHYVLRQRAVLFGVVLGLPPRPQVRDLLDKNYFRYNPSRYKGPLRKKLRGWECKILKALIYHGYNVWTIV